ncbi:SIMPL domain-containing protein [Candidatus Saccharibacteria bacterium]|nr:SIMPL domain-containing protein [Candidatus Saccharibacteria bacterium]
MDTPEVNQPNAGKSSSTKTLALRVNPWLLSVALAAALIATVVMWRPWSAAQKATDRTVSVSGMASISAEPDEYGFYPVYEFKTEDKATGLSQLTAKSDEVVAGLKKAGVADKDIKTNASGYQDYYYYDTENRTHTYSLQISATTHDRDAAQKVQDYLITTTPIGAVSPQATFSAAKQKRLESEGREQATKEARAKADQQAKNLGFKIGAVKSVQDSSDGYGYPMPLTGAGDSAELSVAKEPSMTIQPGQNDLIYTVQVVYYIR